MAAQCESTGDVWFVPALLGLGTPVWDFGARGTLVGLTRGSGGPRSSGPCSRAWPTAAPTSSRRPRPTAATRSRRCASTAACRTTTVFVQALADAIGRPVEISPVLEATTLGAGLLAGLAIGTYASTDEIATTFSPRRTVEPRADDAARAAGRDRWLAARAKAEATIPELSGISF